MGFQPQVAPDLRQMDAAIFTDAPLGLAGRSPPALDERVDYRAGDDLVFIDFEGLTLRHARAGRGARRVPGPAVARPRPAGERCRQLRQLRAGGHSGAAFPRDAPGARAALLAVLHALLDRRLPAPHARPGRSATPGSRRRCTGASRRPPTPSPNTSWPGPREPSPMMRQRHVPLLCGSCQAPTGCQEDRCWRCGATVRRAGSSRRGLHRTPLCRGRLRVVASAPRAPLRRGSGMRRAAAVPSRRSGGSAAAPSRAEDHTRWQRERVGARDRTRQVTLELTAAIDVGDAAYRRLRLRLDKYGTRLDAVHARLYRDPNALS